MYCVLLNDKPLYHQLDRDKLPLSYFHPGYALHSVSFSLLPSKPPSSRSNDCRWILKCYSCSAIPVQQHESPAVQDDGDFSSVLSTTRSALRRRPSRNVTGMCAFSNCYVGKIGYYTVTGPLLVGHGRRLVGRMSYGHCLFTRCGVQWTPLSAAFILVDCHDPPAIDRVYPLLLTTEEEPKKKNRNVQNGTIFWLYSH